MDRGQSQKTPPLFDSTNYVYWKLFLQTLDEKVWLDVEIGWKKPAEPPYAWDEIRSTLLTITLGF